MAAVKQESVTYRT